MNSALIVLLKVAGHQVAIPAIEVQSVIELDHVYPVPQAPPHIVGLSAMRSRSLTVIDCKRALGLNDDTEQADESEQNSGAKKIGAHSPVIEVDGHLYALLVDAVEDVVPALSDPTIIRGGFGAEWERASRGMVETSSGPALILDVRALIDGQICVTAT